MYVPPWPVLNPRYVLPSNGHKALPFPLDDGQVTYFHMARNGVYHLLRALGVHAGDTVLVPDYHHGVEIQAIRAAGASIRYYAVNRRLEPDLDEVAQLCRTKPRALYVIHFLGWPQPIDQLAALCRQWGIILIEDCALALLSAAGGRPLGTFGHYAVFCLYKTLPIPDGGLLVQNENPREDLRHLRLRTCSLASVASRGVGLMLEWARSRSDLLGEALELPKRPLRPLLSALGVRRLPAGAAELDLAQVNLGMSALCHGLLARFDYERIRQRRRHNYLLMQEQLAGRIALLHPDLPDGVCPLFFPFLVGDRPSVAQALRRRGIGALEWWSHATPDRTGAASSHSQFLRDHLLGLPIHQDVTPSQVAYMTDQVLDLEIGC